jgi:hypothetical protein
LPNSCAEGSEGHASREWLSVAAALGADPAAALKLDKAANEQTVKTNERSVRFRIVEFATHGLEAGDLDGLTLDADWVVLSACNTAAAAGAGAEAASGLGRAFFYAGTRAVLVTNRSQTGRRSESFTWRSSATGDDGAARRSGGCGRHEHGTQLVRLSISRGARVAVFFTRLGASLIVPLSTVRLHLRTSSVLGALCRM